MKLPYELVHAPDMKYSSRWTPVIKAALVFSIVFIAIPLIVDMRASLPYMWVPLVFVILILISKFRYQIYIDYGDRLVLQFGSPWNTTWTRASDIQRISFNPRKFFFLSDPTLYLNTNKSGYSSKPTVLKIPILRFSRKNLSILVNDLKNLNPAIELDEFTKGL